MKVYDSYTGKIQQFEPLEDNKVKLYVCGPTVYDLPHLGHARCYITWDMVVRYLRFKGYDVTYVRNVTDVDDKIINKAAEQSKTTDQIASKYYCHFKESMRSLNILDPDIEPKATENIQEMVDMIFKLINDGYAYSVDGDVYFRVKKFEKYGKLSNQSINDLESGARIETSDIKEDPLDFTLWKKVKSDNEIGWESPWGKGRPGWHIECSAMSRKYLGETIDIHAGGQDLLFPHHENEIAQSECSCGKQFAKYWMHNGFVTINSEKMSKSLSNFVSIDDMLNEYDSNTIRFFILTNNYRMPVEFNTEALNSAKAGVKRLKNSLDGVISLVSEDKIIKAKEVVDAFISEFCFESALPFHDAKLLEQFEGDVPAEMLECLVSELKAFMTAMDNDFNTSKALAVLFDIASKTNQTIESNKTKCSAYCAALLIKLSDVLGFNLLQAESADSELVDKLMNLIISIRATARTEKNWALSDQIRDELKEAGIAIKDGKDGTSWNFES